MERPMPSSNIRYANFNARRKLRERLKRAGIEVCPSCGVRLDWERPYQPNSAELDEIIPVSKIPAPLKAQMCVDPRNVQVLCRRCNRIKSDKLYAGKQGKAKEPKFEVPPSPVDW